jgi:uncharacterized membrane protein
MLQRIMNSKKPFIYVLFGMLSGGLIGFVVFYRLDMTKGWNPYGWWFLATFLMTIIGGFVGLFICRIGKKESQLKDSAPNQ